MKNIKVKALLISEDGENFLLAHEYFVASLRTGELIDAKHFQGRHFRLIEQPDERMLVEEEQENV